MEKVKFRRDNGLMPNDHSLVGLVKNGDIDEFKRQISDVYVLPDTVLTKGFRCLSSFKHNNVKELRSSVEVTNDHLTDFTLILNTDFEFKNSVPLWAKKLFSIINILIIPLNPNPRIKINTKVELLFEPIAALIGCDLVNTSQRDKALKEFGKALEFLESIRFRLDDSINSGEPPQQINLRFCESIRFDEHLSSRGRTVINKRKVTVELTEEYVRFSLLNGKNNRKLTSILTEGLALTNPVAYGLAESLTRQYCDRFNQSAGRFDRLSVSTLLASSGLPSIRQVNESNRDSRNRVLLPFLKALNEIEDRGLIKISKFTKAREVELSDEEARELEVELRRIRGEPISEEDKDIRMSFNLFKGLYIHFDVPSLMEESIKDNIIKIA